MVAQICWKCSRAITPAERIETDPKSKKKWAIKYCPFERCAANLDLKPLNVKVWNGKVFRDEEEEDEA